MTALFGDDPDLLAQAARQPAASIETTPAQAFSAAFDAAQRYSNATAWYGNLGDAAQDNLDAFQAKTGERLQNPYRVPSFSTDVQPSEVLAQVRARTAAKAQELGDPSLAFPDDDTLYQAGIAKARASLGRQAQLAGGQQPFGTGIAAAAGGLGAQFTDPIDLGLNAIAIGTMPEGGGIVRSLLGAGINFGAQGAATEAATYGYKSTVNPEYGPGAAAESVASSALGGLAFEAGGKALGALWRTLRVRAPDVAQTLPLPVQDAGTVAERTADLDANNPFKTGVDGESAHNAAIVSTERDLLSGREPTLPDAAQQEGSARVADVNVPREPSPLDLVDQHARATNPDLFAKVDDVEGNIAQARSALSDVLDRRNATPDLSGSQVQVQIDALQDQLDGFTGRRRVSPSANAIRDQITSLQQASAGLTTDAAARDARTEQLLRSRLNDLTNDRAVMGPDVNAARNQAADALGIPRDYAQAIDTNPSASGRAFTPQEPPAAAADASTQAPADATLTPAPNRTRRAKATPPAPVTAPEAARARTAVQVDQSTGRAPTRAFFGKNSVRVRYDLAEAGDLVTSHDADYRVNPDYPAALQPRDRNAAAAREQVTQMAANLQPERLGPSPEANAGAPIVGPDNVVESGNGRTMAIRQAYAAGNEGFGAYRAFLERQGYDTTGFREPVLIGRRVTALDDGERAAFAHAANGSASLRMSATEQALSDARHIDQQVASLLQPGGVDSAANRDFVRALAEKMPQGERGSMMTANGRLSAGGVNRIRAALVARAYGDAEVVARAFDHPDSNIKTIAAALTDSAPDWIKMRDAVARGEIKAGQDITDDVMTAVRSIMRARDERRPVGEVMTQGDMFTSDTSQQAARLFFRDNRMDRFLSKADMAENLQTFARDTLAHRGVDRDLFGAAPPATSDVLAGTLRRSDSRQGAIAEALRPEALEKAANDPRMLAAADADLTRQIEAGRNRVPVEAEDGSVSLGFADAELHGINGEIDAAAEIRACSEPMSEAAE